LKTGKKAVFYPCQKSCLREEETLERFDINPMERLLSAKTTCNMLGTSRTTLWRLNQKNLLRARRLGGRIGYLKSEVEAFLAALPVVGSTEDKETGVKCSNAGK